MELIRAEGITFGYSRSPVLKDVSLSVTRGQIVSLLGPNGSGKSTLLKVLLGIYRPANGSVLFDGESIMRIAPKELAKRVAYVPQTHRMGFAYRVLDVVLMGRTPHKPFFSRYSREDMAIALHCLDRLSILHLKERSYTEISGGERQLTLIARALAQGARTLIMDEPANGLDYGNQIRLLEQIVGLAGDEYTFVMSTHFPDHALWIASHVVMLQDGRVTGAGRPEKVINDEAIFDLYRADVQVLSLNGCFRMCVPRSLLSGNGRRSLLCGPEKAANTAGLTPCGSISQG